MRMRFILSETGTNLRRNLSMLLSLMLVTFIPVHRRFRAYSGPDHQGQGRLV